MSIYLGAGSTAHKMSKLYVGVSGQTRQVQKVYVGVGGQARLVYQSGQPIGGLAVGSIVKIKVNGAAKDFIVVQQGNPDASIYDSSCDGTWLLMKNIYENRAWNSSNVNSYGQSSMHTYLNSTFLGLLEAGVRSAVKQVKIPYRPGSGSSQTSATGANGLSAKVFLLSATEIGFKASSVPIGEGAELAYFDSQSKRVANLNGSAASWALRSPYCDGSTRVMYIDRKGYFNDIICYTSNGVRPCIVLPKGTLLDDNNNVIGG